MPMIIRGKDKLLARLQKMAPMAQKRLEEANRQTADEMVALARSYAPVRTGALRDSIVATPAGQATPAHAQGGTKVVPAGAVAVTAGNSRVRYAHLVEYGTAPHDNAGMFKGSSHPGTARQPFFWSAYRLMRKRMRSRASRALGKSIKEAGK